MARTETRTAEEQNRTAQDRNDQRTQGSQGQQGRASSQGGQMTRRQQAGLAPGAGFGPLAFPLFAGDLFRMTPFSLIRRMSEEMDRALGQINSGQGNSGISTWAPNIEVREQDGKYVVRADLPGMNPDDVTVEVTDAGLVIEGERKRERREQERGGVQRTEVQYGYFARLIPLPDGANIDQANARFENGVLEIAIPVAQQDANRRQIPVQGSPANSGASNTNATNSSGTNASGTSQRSA